MNTAAISSSVCHTHQDLLSQELATFSRIPGMDKLRHAAPDSPPELEAK